MANLLRLIALLAFAVVILYPRTADSACIRNGSNTYCDTRAEADSSALASCVPQAPNTAVLYTADVHPAYRVTVSVGGVPTQYDGIVRSRQSNNANCTSYTNGSAFYWRVVALPEPCLDAVGGGYQEWHSSSSFPPSGTGCRDFGGASCAILFDVLSAPMANGNGTFNYRAGVTFTGSSCSATDENAEEVIEEEDAGDGWKCDPDTGLCTDPNGDGKLCTFNPDGSRSACVPYKPGDGTDPAPEPDPEPEDPRDNRTTSGGGSCSAAPSCSGDPIDCAQLWQQFKTRCALETPGAATGRSCTNGVATSLNCTNMDPARCLSLQVATEAACSLAKIAANSGADGEPGEDGGVDTSGMGSAGDFGDSGFEGSQAWRPDRGEPGGPPELDGFDDSGFLSSRSCPTMPVVQVMGTTIDFNFPQLCWFLGIGSNLVLLFAALASIRIVSRVI